MTEQKTYEYREVKLVKAEYDIKSTNPCGGCFFENTNCGFFVPKITSCFLGEDGNEKDMIFMEANEPVNKID